MPTTDKIDGKTWPFEETPRHCDRDSVHVPSKGGPATYVFRCRTCNDHLRFHWRDLVDARDQTIEMIRLEKRAERAEAAGDDEALDRLVERAEELRDEQAIVDELRG